MADEFVPRLLPKDLTVDDSTQSTQLFSPGHVEARLETFPATTYLTDGPPTTYLDWTKLDQDTALPQLDGARMLLYPKVKDFNINPFNGTGHFGPWMSMTMENKSTPAEVLVVAPGHEEIGCTAIHHDAVFYFYFDPSRDCVYICNHSFRHFLATKRGRNTLYQIPGGQGRALSVGIWDLVFDGQSILEVQVMKRKAWPTSCDRPLKRVASADGNPSKRLKVSKKLVAPLYKPSPSELDENALVKLEKGMKIHVGPRENGYWLTRLDTIIDAKYSAVWRARHSSVPNTDIAVKVVKLRRSDDRWVASTSKNWLREYTIHSCLHHRSIVRLLGCDARFHSLYLEYIDAKALSHWVSPDLDFTGTEQQALRIMEELTSALSHMHSKEIIHGDLKPANVLYNNDRGAVLIDFGLSFQVGNSAQSRGCGTPWYLPPEYMTSGRVEGPETDIWALGVIMLWLFGYIGLPERTYEGWQLPDISPVGTQVDAHEKAMDQMDSWINCILSVRQRFITPKSTKLAQLVGKMLETKASARIDAVSLSQELRNLRLSDSQGDKPDKPPQHLSHDTATAPGNTSGQGTEYTPVATSTPNNDADNLLTQI
ncbi:kinase-like domain-containing protein [Xylaria bambusicola]|uniref:kinase-like domain-containing protein n=1 Tax=Xylaria bambusicola TaxID=326684 RepID=UPI002008D5A1|nr:kinase-like domain-containing protein [Xylaria bambusicola]KAI0503380.1 kinase-like domain-containing protein [Xylaria bambusicola]